VHLDSRVFHPSARSRPAPAALLGADHPLVRDLERLAVAVNQFVLVAAVCFGSAGAWLEGSSAAVSIVAAAAAVDLVLAARVAVLRESRRVHVLELISEGHADLPIVAVERMRGRLRRARHRQRLVTGIDALLAPEVQRCDPVMIPWRFLPADVIAPIRRELVEIGALLRDDSAGLPGIALMELLLTDGRSTLHRAEPRRLHEDLCRARFLLSRGSPWH
jgi:hypothetical protein